MVRAIVATLCLMVIITTIEASASGSETWKSFIGGSESAPAEIEVVEQGSGSILADMTLKGINVQTRQAQGREFQLLSIPQAGWTDETGKPKLPVVRTLLTIPSDGNAWIHIEGEEHLSFTGFTPYPVGKKVVKSSQGGTVYVDEEFVIDDEFYSTKDLYPADLASISFSGYLRGQRLVQLEFHPVRYRPAEGELICYPFLRVRLTYERAGSTSIGLLRDVQQITPYTSIPPLSSYMVSQDGSVSYPENPMQVATADYVIIAPELFYNSATLRQLANWRAQYNRFDVAVVSAERLYYSFGSGRRSDETIRAFMQYAYDFWRAEHMPDKRIGYVLLIGDVELLPTHISDNKSFDEPIATDNWYVCVSGDDLVPDIMQGRLPAKNISELNIMIDKIIQYEQSPLYGEWANNALLMLGTEETLREDMELARDEYLLPAGYNVSEISALNGGNAYEVISELNKGQHIVDYAGHGFVSSWEIFQAEDISKLRNDRMLPAIFSLACSTGYFDHPDKDSLGEAFLKARNGAIAFFGASRLATISSVGFGLSTAVAGLHTYTLGEITMHTKLGLLPYSNDLELYNLLGDPALDLGAPRRWQGMSDLIISPTDISFVPETPKQGEQVLIKVTVYNFGSADARGVRLELHDGGPDKPLIEVANIPLISAGNKTEIQIPWQTPLGKAQHLIYVKAYPGSSEYYKENNDAQKQLLVSLEADGWPKEVEEKTLSAPVTADIDGDGSMELLVQSTTYRGYDKLYIWRSDGQLANGWPKIVSQSRYNYGVQYSNSSAGPAPSVGDLDGDGTPEIVAAFFSDQVYAFRSDGSNLPGWPIRIGGYATTSPVLADLDLDGKLEAIFGVTSGQVLALRYDGSQLPGWPVSTGRMGHLFPVVTDMDGDSVPEVIALLSPLPKTYNTNETSKLYAWRNDGTAVEGWPVQMYGADSILPPAAGDLDGDGSAEIVAISASGDICRIYVWNHDGSLSAGWSIPTGDEIRSAIALGDIDQDGDVEIIASSCYDDSVYAWHHDGRKVFGWPVSISEGYWTSAPVLGDVDGDNQVEIVFASHGGIIYAYKSDSSLLEGWPAQIFDNTSISPPLITDMNGDGKTELVCTTGLGRVHVLSLTGNYGGQSGLEWNMFLHDPAHTGSYNAKAVLPSPPASITASDLPDDKGGSIIISWQLSPDDAKVTGYNIYRSDKPDGQYSIIGKVPRGVSTYTDNTVQIGTTYWYVVRTSDGMHLSVASSPVSAYSFNNFAPQPPVLIYANENIMDGVLDVWWRLNEEPDIAGYKVYAGTSSGIYDKLVNIGMANHYALTGLTNGIKYFIAVTAYDMEGNESLYSNEITAVPKDEDKDPPKFSEFYPKEVVEGTAFYIKCAISDPSGIYDDNTAADGQGVYLLWDDDGELLESSHIMQMSLLSGNIYMTDKKIPGQSIESRFVYQVYGYDDDCDWERAEDRSQGVSQMQTVFIYPSPSIAYNYPNPAPAGAYTDRTIFRYYVKEDADVKIDIYDIAGNLVDSLEDKAEGAKYNEAEWDISHIASGIYVYVLEIQPVHGNKQVIKKKLAIVK